MEQGLKGVGWSRGFGVSGGAGALGLGLGVEYDHCWRKGGSRFRVE